MSKSTLAGKKPLSQKKRSTSAIGAPDFFRNKLMLPQEVADDIAKRGLEPRWIAYKPYIENGNSHDKGWVAYRRPKEATSVDELQLGSSPDGIIRRGDLVLAVRKKEMGDRHRAYNEERAYNQTFRHKKAMADELRQMAKEANLEVTEGYEEDENDSDDA